MEKLPRNLDFSSALNISCTGLILPCGKKHTFGYYNNAIFKNLNEIDQIRIK